jgi:hypothetical protein
MCDQSAPEGAGADFQPLGHVAHARADLGPWHKLLAAKLQRVLVGALLRAEAIAAGLLLVLENDVATFAGIDHAALQ